MRITNPRDAQHRLCAVHAGPSCFVRRDCAPDHHADDPLRIDFVLRQFPDPSTVAQHHNTVGQFSNFRQTMRNIQDAHTIRAQLQNHLHQPAHFAGKQAAGRFVENDDSGLRRQRPGHLDQLPLREAQMAHERRSPTIEPQSRDQFPGATMQLPPMGHRKPADPADRLLAQENILGDRQILGQIQLLVDRMNAQLQRGARRRDRPLTIIDQDPAGVRRVNAAEDFDQRRFAGAIFADQPHNFARGQRKADLIKRPHAGKTLADPLEPQQGGSIVRRKCLQHVGHSARSPTYGERY